MKKIIALLFAVSLMGPIACKKADHTASEAPEAAATVVIEAPVEAAAPAPEAAPVEAAPAEEAPAH